MCECLFCRKFHDIDKRISMPISKAIPHLEEYMKKHKVRLDSNERKIVERLRVDIIRLNILAVSLCNKCKFGMSYIVE